MRIFAAINWDELRTKMIGEAWYDDIVSTMRSTVDKQLSYAIDVPKHSGGWIHRYVSPDNWMPLIYDSNSPTIHRSKLGDSYAGEPYDGAWRVWRHRELANLARDSALLFRITQDEKYLNASISILEQYADLYLNFDADWDAENWMLKGRAMNQALTEALWVYPLVLAYDLVSDLMPDTNGIRDMLLIPVADTLTQAHDVLIDRGDAHHNYVAWLLAALSCIAFTLDDKALIERVIDGYGGFKVNLDRGVLADNLQYEATPYYHNFVVLAYCISALAAKCKDYDLTHTRGNNGQSIVGMWKAFSQLAFPNGTIIEANDGSYWQDSIYDPEICEVYEIAYAHTPDSTYAWLLDKAYKRRGIPRCGWTALLFAKQDLPQEDPQLESQLLEDSGFALLHNDSWSIALPFGDYEGGHSHFDKISLNVYPFSTDAGTPLYGIEERKTWYQQTLAHNTIVVDGYSQNKSSAECTSFKAEQVKLRSSTLYDGVILERDIQLNAAVIDRFSATSDDTHQYDWIFHSDSEWHVCNASTQNINLVYANEGAGQNVQIFAELACDSDLVVETQFDKQTYSLRLSATQPFQLFLARCPGRSQMPHLQRYMLIGRVSAKSVTFQTEIMVKK
ncbi:MAG: heparinase II/III family protein [Chloroflexota bacterium]